MSPIYMALFHVPNNSNRFGVLIYANINKDNGTLYRVTKYKNRSYKEKGNAYCMLNNNVQYNNCLSKDEVSSSHYHTNISHLNLPSENAPAKIQIMSYENSHSVARIGIRTMAFPKIFLKHL